MLMCGLCKRESGNRLWLFCVLTVQLLVSSGLLKVPVQYFTISAHGLSVYKHFSTTATVHGCKYILQVSLSSDLT